MATLVVAGAGAGVGVTAVTAAVAALAADRGARVAAVQTAQTGLPDGAPGELATLTRLSGVADVHELARFPDAVPPAAAARRSGRPPLDLVRAVDAVLRLVDRDLVLVRGCGGLLSRHDDDGLTLADLARTLRVPVLLVGAADAPDQAALALEALAHRGLSLEGVVVGRWPAQPALAHVEGLAELERLAARPLLGALPEGAVDLPRAAFLEQARAGLALPLGGRWSRGPTGARRPPGTLPR